jgi:hypothetical protein
LCGLAGHLQLILYVHMGASYDRPASQAITTV